MNFFKRHFFLIGIALVGVGAWLFPTVGIFLGKHGGKTAAITLIFFMSGATIPLGHLGEDLRKWRCHTLIQGFSLGIIPLLIWLTSGWITVGPIRYGVFLVAAIPTTISSCVVLTTVAGGRTPAALINAVGGNLLGVFLSPVLLTLMIGTQTDRPAISIGETILKLLMLVALPFAVGKLSVILRPRLLPHIKRVQPVAAQAAILFVIFCAFCQSGDKLWGRMDEMWGAFLYLAFAHIAFVIALTLFAAAMRLKAPEATAAVICGSQKTLALGIALGMAFFKGTNIDSDMALVPLVFYHVFQLAVAGFLVAYWAKRNQSSGTQ